MRWRDHGRIMRWKLGTSIYVNPPCWVDSIGLCDKVFLTIIYGQYGTHQLVICLRLQHDLIHTNHALEVSITTFASVNYIVERDFYAFCCVHASPTAWHGRQCIPAENARRNYKKVSNREPCKCLKSIIMLYWIQDTCPKIQLSSPESPRDYFIPWSIPFLWPYVQMIDMI